MNKKIAIEIAIGIILVIAIIIGVLVWVGNKKGNQVNQVSQVLSPSSQVEKPITKNESDVNTKKPEVQNKNINEIIDRQAPVMHQLYAGERLYNKDKYPYWKMIESIILKKTDVLPMEFTIDGEKILIKQVILEKKSESSFSIFLVVDYNNKDERFGFYYKGANISDNKDGCLGGKCTSRELSYAIWDGPSDASGNRDVYSKSINLYDIDYDIQANDWNYIKIASLFMKENLPSSIPTSLMY